MLQGFISRLEPYHVSEQTEGQESRPKMNTMLCKTPLTLVLRFAWRIIMRVEESDKRASIVNANR